jgi:chaperonin GroES
MLNLENHIRLDKETIMSPNLTGRFSDDDLTALGNYIWEGYDRDSFSRQKWEKRTQAAMDLAVQVQKEKNFPWPGCSNVAFPLVTIAALQFHSRAYPAIVPGREIVKCRVNGEDPDGQQQKRAERVAAHMSYQLLEEDPAWEEQHDRLLINQPIVGCAFKKTYRNGAKVRNSSELVLAQDLVMDYYAKSVEECPRKTHVIPTFRNEIYEGVMSGIFRDIRDMQWYQSNATPKTGMAEARKDQRTGQMVPNADATTPYRFLEQHVDLDLDGDGYAEPYICTIEETSRCVVRLVSRIDSLDQIRRNSRNQIVRITPTEYFTKYGFIPSPDGGIYDIGFGVLLGPLNESVNSILNQLVDAGTMSNAAGGFLGRGAKIRGGTYTFAPLEWKRVDSTGDDLRKSIYPLPVREPSAVLFQLLSLLINYTNRISGTTEATMGENVGQNTPAYNMQSMIEQGQKIYNAIFKRIWRSMKEEFQKLYLLNRTFLPDTMAFGAEGLKILREDYLGDANRVTPVADPSITSEAQRLQIATAIRQAAYSAPGYNIELVEQNYLRALNVDGWQSMYPGPNKMPPQKNPKVQIEEMRLQAKQMDMQLKQQQFVADLMEQRRVNNAKILQLEAQAAKLLAEAGGTEMGHQIAAFNAAIGALKAHDDALRSRVELMMKAMELDNEPSGSTPSGGGIQGMAGAPSDQGAAPNPQGMAVGP